MTLLLPRRASMSARNARTDLAVRSSSASRVAACLWCVQTKSNDSYEHKGRVYLELASANAAECARGLAVLRAVVEGDGAALAIARA